MDLDKLRMLAGVQIKSGQLREYTNKKTDEDNKNPQSKKDLDKLTESSFDKKMKKAKSDKEMVNRVKNGLKKTIEMLRNEAEKDNDRDLKKMYTTDADDYAAILKSVNDSDQMGARKAFQDMDTANRDAVFGLDLNKVSRKALADYLGVQLMGENCGQPHAEDEELEVPYGNVICPHCDTAVRKEGFYDHMVEVHPSMMGFSKKEEEEAPETDMEVQAEPVGHMTAPVENGMNEKAEDATIQYSTNQEKEVPVEGDDSSKIKVPAEIKKALKDSIKELRVDAKKNESRDRDLAEFYTNCANAFDVVLAHLEKGTFEGMQQASIHTTKLMGPMVQRIPNIVYDFISRGGAPKTLTTLFQEVKIKK